METTVLGLRVLLALACVIGLIWVLARRAGWGKGRRRPAGPAVEVVGRQALGRHAGVAVIAVGERRLLLGYGEQNVTMLTELEPGAAEEEAPEEPATTRTPMTLGDLAAAVLPSQRRRARAAAPVTVSATSFEDALAAATVAGDPAVPAVTTSVPPATPVTPVPVPVVDAAAAAASATAAARAA
ncbi:flagellar biosynthetic protein FliO, partial [Cellulomonas triticagri]